MSPNSKLRPLLLTAFLSLCGIWYIKQNVLNVLPTPALSDFRFYYYAADRILHGESPYVIADYVYPPLLAFLLVPLARFDYYTGRWIWFVLSHLFLLSGAYLLWRRMGRDSTTACVIGLVWSLGWVAQDSFATGQPDPLLTLLIVIAYVGSGWMQGVAVGAGFAVKLIPATLGLLAPLERNWRAAFTTLGSVVILVVGPWSVVALLHGPSKPASTDYLFGTPCVLSWSLPSIALRVLEPPRTDGKLPQDWITGWDLPRLHLSGEQKRVSVSVALVTLAAGLSALGLRTRGRLDSENVPIVGAALISLTLAASPIAWWHYQTLQYPGVAILLAYSIRRRRWDVLASAAIPILFLFALPDAVLRFYYHQREQWPDAPVLMYFWTSVSPVASLSLFGLLLRMLPRGTSGPERRIIGAAIRPKIAAAGC